MDDNLNDSLEELEKEGRRRKLMARIVGVVVGVPLLIGFAIFMGDVAYPGVGDSVRKIIAGEQDIFGNRYYSPSHEVSDAQFAKVDLERVHSDLLPLWLSAHSYDSLGEPSERTQARYDELLAAVEPDANLHELVGELGDLLLSEEALEESDRILYLTWAWGDYLRQRDQPYHLEANMVIREDSAMLYTKNYALADELRFEVDDEEYEALLAHRIDRTNVVENYLCRNTDSQHRPLWIVDTSAEEAADVVWPMLSPVNDDTLEPLEAAFAELIREEAAEHLSEEALGLLDETAPTRHRMLRTRKAINDRDCNDFRFSYTPRLAFDVSRLGRLWSRASRSEEAACPSITAGELRTLIDTSEALEARREDLTPALEELTAFASRPRLLHEVRHYRDDIRYVSRDVVMPCPGCDRSMRAPSRGELSAYLAGVAYSGAPALGMYRICHVNTNSRTYHKHAISPLVSRLAAGQDCLSGPVDGLEEQAREADVEFFDRDSPIELVSQWPDRLPITQ